MVVDSHDEEEVSQIKEVDELDEFPVDIRVKAVVVKSKVLKSKVLEREGLEFIVKKDSPFDLLRYALDDRYKWLSDRMKKEDISPGVLCSITITASYPRAGSKGLSVDPEDASDIKDKAFKKVFAWIKD
ncbi:MAG: MFS general substrate transporter [Aureobasidium pullulans]|nr:MAG: MFS general substrate transporter [Aureobasidium pullulans]